jgi:hypothetical protein
MNADDPSVAQEVVGGSVCVRAQRFPSRVSPLFLARACLYVVNRKPLFPGSRPTAAVRFIGTSWLTILPESSTFGWSIYRGSLRLE